MKTAREKKRKKTADAAPPPPVEEKLAVCRNMTIYEARSLKDELLNTAAEASVIELDLSRVAEIDTAGLQLLMLAEREMRQHGRTLRLAACSPAVQDLVDLYDLAELFGNPALPAPVMGKL